MEEVHALSSPHLVSVWGLDADAGVGVPCFLKSGCQTIPPHGGLVSLSELKFFQ